MCTALSLAPPGAAEAPRGVIEIVVHGLRSGDGKVRLALYDDPEGFPSREGSIRGGAVRLDGDVAVFVFDDVPYGTYALSAFHDENDNGKFDTNFLGLPLEGYGFSRDAAVVFGPPAFEDAAFELRSSKRTVAINMRY